MYGKLLIYERKSRISVTYFNFPPSAIVSHRTVIASYIPYAIGRYIPYIITGHIPYVIIGYNR